MSRRSKSTPIFCYQANGGDCKNKVWKRRNFICPLGHGEVEVSWGDVEIEVLPGDFGDIFDSIFKKASLSPIAQMESARSEDLATRKFLALSEELVEEVQRQLANDRSPEVRQYLAQNPSLVREIQEQLANDGYPSVRASLAQNPSLVREIQEQLASSEDVEIRQYLAMNPSLTEKVHKQLANDVDPLVGKILRLKIA